MKRIICIAVAAMIALTASADQLLRDYFEQLNNNLDQNPYYGKVFIENMIHDLENDVEIDDQRRLGLLTFLTEAQQRQFSEVDPSETIEFISLLQSFLYAEAESDDDNGHSGRLLRRRNTVTEQEQDMGSDEVNNRGYYIDENETDYEEPWAPWRDLLSPMELRYSGHDINGDGKIDITTAYCRSDSWNIGQPALFFHVVSYVEGADQAVFQSFGRNLTLSNYPGEPTYQFALDDSPRDWYTCPAEPVNQFHVALWNDQKPHDELIFYANDDEMETYMQRKVMGWQAVVTIDGLSSCCLLESREYDIDLRHELICWMNPYLPHCEYAYGWYDYQDHDV